MNKEKIEQKAIYIATDLESCCKSEEIKLYVKTTAYAAAIKMAELLLNDLWTSVEDELPEQLENEDVSDYVFVRMVGNNHDYLRYDFACNNWYDCHGNGHWGITHWMPIPEIGGKK